MARFPGGTSGVITADEARERAREWAGSVRRDAEPELGVLEFDDGYVVWVIQPGRRTDRPGPPDSVGAGHAVIDKHTGELSTWGSLPPRVIAERYQHDLRARRRFPARVLAVLRDAGWFPGRDVGDLVASWLRERYDEQPDAARRLPMFPAAGAALAEFGGLRLEQYGPGAVHAGGGFGTEIHPSESRFALDRYTEFAALIGEPVFPFAIYADGGSVFVIDARGRVFLLHWAGYYVIAETVDGAITAMIEGLGELTPIADDGTE